MKKIKLNKLNKKGILFLDTMRSVLLMVLLLAVVAIAMFVAVVKIVESDTSLSTRTIDFQNLVNSSFILNDTAQTPTSLVGLTNCIIRNEVVKVNATTMNSANYTLSGCTLMTASNASSGFNLSYVNFSGTYKYDVDGYGSLVEGNVTSGTVDFFKNIPTMFTVLGAAVIILAIVLILVAANRYGNLGDGGNMAFGGNAQASNL